VLQCIENGPDGTLVARPDGSRLLIEPSIGARVQVQLFWDPRIGWIPDEVRESRF
jgi:hypothetical protein